jgi:hypothetical protein
VKVDPRDGTAEIPEPAMGQKVSFVLRRTSGADPKTTSGIVLKLNGENTLYRQRLPELQCLRWVLDPGDPPTVISGFQATDTTARAFRVSSREESKLNEFYYGADVGTMSLVVFRGKRTSEPPPLDLGDDAEDLAALSRGLLPEKPAKNLAALQAQLRFGVLDAGERAVRGIVEESQTTTTSNVQRVRFQPEPDPVMSAVIRYYKPR